MLFTALSVASTGQQQLPLGRTHTKWEASRHPAVHLWGWHPVSNGGALTSAE